MWDIKNGTAFEASATFERDHELVSWWCVWLKATFRMRHQASCLYTRDQIPVFQQPIYVDPNTETSPLLSDSDTYLTKKNTDVLLTARGRPPDDDPFSVYPVRLTAGNIDKELFVHPAYRDTAVGPEIDHAKTREAPILSYGEAFGGVALSLDDQEIPHPQNPLGKGYAPGFKAPQKAELARVFYKGGSPRKSRKKQKPAAFTALEHAHPIRAQYVGTYDEKWQRYRAPFLPEDFNPLYRQTMPEDQQYNGIITHDEEVSLTNVTGPHDAHKLTFKLPVLNLEMLTDFDGGWIESNMSLQTVQLYPDRGLVTVCYLGQMSIGTGQNDVKVKRSVLKLRDYSGFRVLPEDIEYYRESLGRVV